MLAPDTDPKPNQPDEPDQPEDEKESADIGIEDLGTGQHAQPPDEDLQATRFEVTHVGLQEVDAHGEVAFHRIVTAEFRIGRHPDSNLSIGNDGRVSRHHATILATPTGYEIRDEKSANGTRVSGRLVTGTMPLQHGDKIVIGSREFTFVLHK
ncbi:MAG: FHA domain-containing protein [Planctomycetes bacterium]|nr:FHA domain-containing protein [Planctomycetota bacterium]